MRKLAAIMFSDITGYSAMMSKDEKNAMNILEKNRSIHKSLIAKYNGQYIKEIGDGTLAIFQSALDAVLCAIKIRNACTEEPGLTIRIGIHLGDVVLQENDVFGDSVNIASRIESAGEPGGIFISEKVHDDIKNKEGISAEFYGEKNLKNIPDPVKIYRVTTLENNEFSYQEYGSGKKDIQKPVSAKKIKRTLAVALLLVIAISAVAYFYLSQFSNKDKLKDLRSADGKISVAVLPFYNMTNDSTWNVWQEGIQDMLISSLSNSSELKVRQFESINSLLKSKGVVNYASLTPDFAGAISQKLDAGVFIFGNIKKAGPSLRISAQLIDSKTQEVFKSVQIDGSANEADLFPMLDSLTKMVNDFLLISKLEKELTPDYQRMVSTKSPEAYRNFIQGKNAFASRDFDLAHDFLSRAAQLDSNFSMAIFLLSITNLNLDNYDEAKSNCRRIYAKRESEPMMMKIMINALYALNFESPREEIIYLRQVIVLDDQNPMFLYQLANNYLILEQYDMAITEFEKALEIYHNWGVKPDWQPLYGGLITAYFGAGNLEKAQSVLSEMEKDFPGDNSINYWNIILALKAGDTLAAKNYIKAREERWKGSGRPEYLIDLYLGMIYEKADQFDEAEMYYRKSYALNPDNAEIVNTLGYFLVDTERNITEGMTFLTKAFNMEPDNYLFMDSKGWGLYKQGKQKEARALIEKGWSLSPIYNHEIYSHLQAVK